MRRESLRDPTVDVRHEFTITRNQIRWSHFRDLHYPGAVSEDHGYGIPVRSSSL